MKIALVSEHASPLACLGGVDAGGQNVHVAALAAELARRGHRVVVHTRRDDWRLPAEVHADGIVVDHVPAGPPEPVAKDDLLPWMPDFGRGLHQRWWQDPPDVVHAHFWMSGIASLAAARRLDIPIVQTFHALGSVKRRHQGSADTSPPARIGIERYLITEVDHIIATCHDEVEEIQGLATPRARSVIPCGVDLSLFSPSGAVATRSGRFRLLVIGRLVPRKGIADVLRALTSLPDVELLIAGGPAVEQLETDSDARPLLALSRGLGLGSQVRFLGRVGHGQLPALIRSADAVVTVPFYEPFGIVPLEAMACGVPVVVSAVGGLRESVVDGRTGLHVPPGHPDALAEAVRRLQRDPALARRLGRAGAERASRLYGWPQVVSQTEAVYERTQRARSTGVPISRLLTSRTPAW